MAGSDRTATRVIEFERRLELDVTDFHPFQAMRWLENVYEGKRFGTALRPSDEPVRFDQAPTLAFTGPTLATFQGRREGRPARLSTFGFGLFGTNGPLPLHLTQLVRDLQRSGDRAFKRFIDLFHHRMISLFYRAWADSQPAVQFDRPDEDRFAGYIGALAGFSLPTVTHRTTLPDTVRYHYIGHFAGHTRHADGLERLLSDYFAIPMRVQQFVGHWIELSEESRWRLGESPETGTLGKTVALGEQMWIRQDRFRIVAGPLDLDDYLRLMPGGESLQRMVDIVRSYVGDELSWELQLIMFRKFAQSTQLGGHAQLGMNTWLLSEPLKEDPADMVIEPMRHTA